MTTSRAVVMAAPRSLDVRSLPVPSEPPGGGAILRILANGICGSDWHLYAGELTQVRGRGFPFPIIPGHEMVGRVVAIDPVGQAEWGVVTGDRVVLEPTIRCGRCRACVEGRAPACARRRAYGFLALDEAPGLWGGMSEYMTILPGTSVFEVPTSLEDVEAGLSNVVGNAMHWTLEDGQVGVGDRVLVLGSGQRGLACIAAAREAGAAQVIATGLGRSAGKLDLARRFGATEVIEADTVDTAVAVADYTDGEGVDVCIDTVPEAHGPLVDAIASLRLGGRLVIAGFRSGPAPSFPVDAIRGKQLHVVGTSATTRWSVGNGLRMLAERRFPFAELVTHTVGLDEAEWALRLVGREVGDGQAIHVSVVP